MPRTPSIAAVLPVLAVSAALAAGVGPVTPQALDALVQQGKLDEAIASGRNAVNARPDDPDLRKSLAAALAVKAKRVEKVADVPVSSSEIEAGAVRVKLPKPEDLRVRTVYEAPLFEEAVLHLEKAVSLAPKRVDLRESQIYLLSDAGRSDRAVAALRSAIAELPRSAATARALASLGAERTKRGDAAQGAALLAAVGEAYPKDAAVQSDLGFSLTKLGRKEEALAAFDRAAAAAPEDVRVLRMRATAAMMFRDYGKARSAYESSFRASRAEPDRLGAAVAAYGIDPAAAVSELEALSVEAPASDPAVVEMASQLAAAAKAGPGSDAAVSLGRKALAQGQPVLAIPILDRAARAKPPAREAVALRRKAYEDLGFAELASP